MMFLGIIGKRFGDAGLRDLLIQSEVLAEGSVDRALSGKMYNRAVRYLKLVYEALFRLLLDMLHTKYESDQHKKSLFDDLTEKVKELSTNLCQDDFEQFVDSDVISKYMTMVIDFLDHLNDSGGNLAKFWLSFVEMAKLLLNLLSATRAGIWHLFLETIRDIFPYTFAYENINYSRYLTVMLGELSSLETDHPDVYQEFMEGNFTVQLSEHCTFGRMEPDKVIEMTINKDTKTPGGTTGFSMKQDAIMRWTLNSSYRAESTEMSLYVSKLFSTDSFTQRSDIKQNCQG